MDVTSIAAGVSAAAGAVGAIAAAWPLMRGRRRARQDALRNKEDMLHELSQLPPGSRIVNLGDQGMFIEIGEGAVVDRGERDAAQ